MKLRDCQQMFGTGKGQMCSNQQQTRERWIRKPTAASWLSDAKTQVCMKNSKSHRSTQPALFAAWQEMWGLLWQSFDGLQKKKKKCVLWFLSLIPCLAHRMPTAGSISLPHPIYPAHQKQEGAGFIPRETDPKETPTVTDSWDPTIKSWHSVL